MLFGRVYPLFQAAQERLEQRLASRALGTSTQQQQLHHDPAALVRLRGPLPQLLEVIEGHVCAGRLGVLAPEVVQVGPRARPCRVS